MNKKRVLLVLFYIYLVTITLYCTSLTPGTQVQEVRAKNKLLFDRLYTRLETEAITYNVWTHTQKKKKHSKAPKILIICRRKKTNKK